MDQNIGVLERVSVVSGIQPMRLGMGGVEACNAQDRAQLPYVRSNDEIGAHLAASRRWQYTSDPTVFQHLPVAIDSAANNAHGATGIDGRGQMSGRQPYGMFIGKRSGDDCKGNLQIREMAGQVARAELLECISMQKLRPEDRSCQFDQILPTHSGGDTRADDTPGTGSSDK